MAIALTQLGMGLTAATGAEEDRLGPNSSPISRLLPAPTRVSLIVLPADTSCTPGSGLERTGEGKNQPVEGTTVSAPRPRVLSRSLPGHRLHGAREPGGSKCDNPLLGTGIEQSHLVVSNDVLSQSTECPGSKCAPS